MNTLGHSSDKKIFKIFSEASNDLIFPPLYKQGKNIPTNKKSKETVDLVKNHINSFHPAITHYRRKHAPLRRYLSPELNITTLYNELNDNHLQLVSREFYRKVIKEMNIGFCRLGEEECELCLTYEAHAHDCRKEQVAKTMEDIISYVIRSEHQVGCIIDKEDASNCELCHDWKEHIYYAVVCRKEYESDRDIVSVENTTTHYGSTDMQKVILLPVMIGVKTCIFTRKLVTFHQTFATLGGEKLGKRKPIGVIWNEAVSGRNDEDLTSVYIRYIHDVKNRDFQNVIFCGQTTVLPNTRIGPYLLEFAMI